MAFGPARAGLEVVWDTLISEPALAGYHLLASSVRGDLLEKLGRFAEARAECERAASQAHSQRPRNAPCSLERAAPLVPADREGGR